MSESSQEEALVSFRPCPSLWCAGSRFRDCLHGLAVELETLGGANRGVVNLLAMRPRGQRYSIAPVKRKGHCFGFEGSVLFHVLAWHFGVDYIFAQAVLLGKMALLLLLLGLLRYD